MQKLYPIQTRFTSGEITPKMYAAFDMEVYKSAVAELTNFITRPQGSVYRRGGFEFITSFPGKTTGRLFEYVVSATQSFAIMLMEDTCYALTATGFSEADDVVKNYTFAQGATDWTVVTSVGGAVSFNSVSALCTLSTTNNAASYAAVRQQVTVQAGKDYTLIVDLISQTASTQYQVKIGTTAGASDVANFLTSQPTLRATVPTGANTTLWVEVSITGSPLKVLALDSIGLYYSAGTVTQQGVVLTSPYKAGDLSTMQATMAPQGAAMYFTHPNYAPHKLTYNIDTGVWELVPVAFVGTPASWTGQNNPITMTFFQGRSWWGGTPKEPATFWASKSGAYEDLTVGTAADAGMVFTLSYRGAIQWMAGVKNLLIGTDTGEFIVTSDTPPIKPGDIQVEQQSAYGSTARQIVEIGNNVMYISADQRKARVMGYRWEEDAWTSTDLTFTSEHISRRLLRTITYSRSPESILWFTDFAGKLIGCSYEPSLKILGWHKHASWIPFIDVMVENARGRSTLWCIRLRSVNDVPTLYLERYTEEAYMDSCVIRNYDIPTQVVTGLEHLEGELVQVQVNDATHRDLVVTGGQVVLDITATRVILGKQYISTLTTLPIEATTQQGSSLPLMKRWNKIFARIIESRKPLVQGSRPPERHAYTPMDTPEPAVFSEDIKTVNLGWDQQFKVTVAQDLPYAFELLAIFGESAMGSN